MSGRTRAQRRDGALVLRARCSRASSRARMRSLPDCTGRWRWLDQLGQAGIGVARPRRELVRVAGGVADALDAGDLGDDTRAARRSRRRPRRPAAPVMPPSRREGVDVLAEQRDLLDALLGEPGDSRPARRRAGGHLLAARVRHDAERAVLGAAFHDRDEGASALHPCGGQVVELLDLGKADVDLRRAGRRWRASISSAAAGAASAARTPCRRKARARRSRRLPGSRHSRRRRSGRPSPSGAGRGPGR